MCPIGCCSDQVFILLLAWHYQSNKKLQRIGLGRNQAMLMESSHWVSRYVACRENAPPTFRGSNILVPCCRRKLFMNSLSATSPDHQANTFMILLELIRSRIKTPAQDDWHPCHESLPLMSPAAYTSSSSVTTTCMTCYKRGIFATFSYLLNADCSLKLRRDWME